VKYFHRTPLAPAGVLRQAAEWYGARLSPIEEGASRLRFGGPIGHLSVSAMHEGHGTLITVETDQPGESEIDRLAKRFLTLVHAAADPGHVVRGAY
jgi:hypothetical protein